MHNSRLTYKIIQLNLCNAKEIKISFVSLPAYKQSVDINLISWLNPGFSGLICMLHTVSKQLNTYYMYICFVYSSFLILVTLFLSSFFLLSQVWWAQCFSLINSQLHFHKNRRLFTSRCEPRSRHERGRAACLPQSTSGLNINS